jgi:hypothetical protein
VELLHFGEEWSLLQYVIDHQRRFSQNPLRVSGAEIEQVRDVLEIWRR